MFSIILVTSFKLILVFAILNSSILIQKRYGIF
nr:MAG TPA: TMEM119 family [Caudoviricetes sp.]